MIDRPGRLRAMLLLACSLCFVPLGVARAQSGVEDRVQVKTKKIFGVGVVGSAYQLPFDPKGLVYGGGLELRLMGKQWSVGAAPVALSFHDERDGDYDYPTDSYNFDDASRIIRWGGTLDLAVNVFGTPRTKVFAGGAFTLVAGGPGSGEYPSMNQELLVYGGEIGLAQLVNTHSAILLQIEPGYALTRDDHEGFILGSKFSLFFF
jgi:hypothetical protein